ncbi:hypothetical protein ScPMuIL_008671 [Solemya velum]
MPLVSCFGQERRHRLHEYPIIDVSKKPYIQSSEPTETDDLEAQLHTLTSSHKLLLHETHRKQKIITELETQLREQNDSIHDTEIECKKQKFVLDEQSMTMKKMIAVCSQLRRALEVSQDDARKLREDNQKMQISNELCQNKISNLNEKFEELKYQKLVLEKESIEDAIDKIDKSVQNLYRNPLASDMRVTPTLHDIKRVIDEARQWQRPTIAGSISLLTSTSVSSQPTSENIVGYATSRGTDQETLELIQKMYPLIEIIYQRRQVQVDALRYILIKKANMSAPSVRKRLIPKRNHRKYDFVNHDKQSKITKLKNTFIEKWRKRHPEKVILEAAVYLGEFFNQIYSKKSDLTNQQKIICDINKDLDETNRDTTRPEVSLNDQAKIQNWELAEQQTVIFRLHAELNEKELEISQQRTIFDGQISDLQCKLEEYQRTVTALETQLGERELETTNRTDDNSKPFTAFEMEFDRETYQDRSRSDVDLLSQLEDLQAQKTALENEMLEIRQKSQEILTINMNNCNGVAIGNNADINMSMPEDGVVMETSAEVKKNLEAISRLWEDTNAHLLKQTNVIKRIDHSMADLATHRTDKHSGLTPLIENTRGLIHQACSKEKCTISESNRTQPSSDISSMSSQGSLKECVMWSTDSHQLNAQENLELLPKMYPMIEQMYQWMSAVSEEK